MERLDFSDVRGLDQTVRQVAAAAVKNEHMLLVGPPGIGKTMIARRVPTLLGPLSILEEAWVRSEYAAAGFALPCKRTRVGRKSGETLDSEPAPRPFRAPHHTCSAKALCGGWVLTHRATCAFLTALVAKCDCRKDERYFRAGELQLARHGVLMLDEVMELSVGTLNDLRLAMARMGSTRPLIVATTTPCPCGWRGSDVRKCACTAGMIERWQQRHAMNVGILGIKHEIAIRSLTLTDLRSSSPGPSSAELRASVE